MQKIRFKGGPNSFKLGLLAGICFFLTVDSILGLFVSPDMQITRFLLAIVFGSVGLGCSYLGCRKAQ